MPRTIRGLAAAAVESFAAGRDDEAGSYFLELNNRCVAHADDAHKALMEAGYPRALAVRMTEYAFGRAKRLNGLYDRIRCYLPEEQAAAMLVAEVFAERACHERDINRRGRLYKLACRHAGIDIVDEAFLRRYVRVQTPLDGRHPGMASTAALVQAPSAPSGWRNS